MNNLIRTVTLIFVMSLISCSAKTSGTIVLIKTNLGDIRLKLYDETPIHRDNFIKLVKDGYLDSTLFHRVIKDFMIQGGDPESKNAVAGKSLGEGGPGYTLRAEFNFPKYFHKKGALAAAREGDKINPEKKSAGSQFYIVQGEVVDDAELAKIENKIRSSKRRIIFNDVLVQYDDSLNMLQMQGKKDEIRQMQQSIMSVVNKRYAGEREFSFPQEVKDVYKTIGGVPHLDTNYTVFGEVMQGKTLFEKVMSLFGKKYGFEVIDAIAYQETDSRNRPLKDVIMEVKLIKE